MPLITPVTGETNNYYTNGIVLDQGSQAIRLGNGLTAPSAISCYTNGNELIRITSTVGIGTMTTDSSILKIDNGASVCGISFGKVGVGYDRYIGLTSNGSTLAGFQGMKCTSTGDVSFFTQRQQVSSESFRILSSGSIGIGTTSVASWNSPATLNPPSVSVSVNGGITASYSIHLSLKGVNSLYDGSGTKLSGSQSSSQYYFPYYKTVDTMTQNWSPSYLGGYYRLELPYTGIYHVTYVLYKLGAELDVFLSKNLGILTSTTNNITTTINDLDVGDDRLLAVQYSPSTYSECHLSATVYAQAGDYISPGCFLRSGTLDISKDTNQISSFRITLVTRTL